MVLQGHSVDNSDDMGHMGYWGDCLQLPSTNAMGTRAVNPSQLSGIRLHGLHQVMRMLREKRPRVVLWRP